MASNASEMDNEEWNNSESTALLEQSQRTFDRADGGEAAPVHSNPGSGEDDDNDDNDDVEAPLVAGARRRSLSHPINRSRGSSFLRHSEDPDNAMSCSETFSSSEMTPSDIDEDARYDGIGFDSVIDDGEASDDERDDSDDGSCASSFSVRSADHQSSQPDDAKYQTASATNPPAESASESAKHDLDAAGSSQLAASGIEMSSLKQSSGAARPPHSIGERQPKSHVKRSRRAASSTTGRGLGRRRGSFSAIVDCPYNMSARRFDLVTLPWYVVQRNVEVASY